jgi:hypothetical protein
MRGCVNSQDPANNGAGPSTRRGGKTHAALIAVNAGDYDDKGDQDSGGEDQSRDHDQDQ